MYREFYVSHQGTKLYCREFGTGDPMLMIHGACTDSDFFRDTAEYLAWRYRVYTYDRGGYGRSDDLAEGGYTISAQAEEAAAVIHTVGEPCHIVAHSAGTVVAMELVTKYPELVRKILLHEPVASDCAPLSSLANLEEISGLIRAGENARALTLFLPRIGQKDPRGREATEEELVHMTRNNRRFMKHEFDDMVAYRGDYDALRALPITVGVGELSRDTFRWNEAIAFAEKIGAPVVYFPAAHNCAYDLPGEFAWLTEGVLDG